MKLEGLGMRLVFTCTVGGYACRSIHACVYMQFVYMHVYTCTLMLMQRAKFRARCSVCAHARGASLEWKPVESVGCSTISRHIPCTLQSKGHLDKLCTKIKWVKLGTYLHGDLSLVMIVCNLHVGS